MKKIKTEIRRNQIRKAAAEIISENSLHKLTIAEIAKRVDVTKSNIYRHFKSKDEIINDLLNDINIELKKILINSEKEINTCDQLRNIFFNHIKLLERYNGAPFLIFLDKSYMKHSNAKEIMKRIIKHYLNFITEVFDRGVTTGELMNIRDSKQTSLVFLGNIQAVVFQWVTSGFNSK